MIGRTSREARQNRLRERCVELSGISRSKIMEILRDRNQFRQLLNADDDWTLDELVEIEENIMLKLKEEEQQEAMIREAEERNELEHYINKQQNLALPCPLCKEREIFLTGAVFHCSCGFRLDTNMDCVSLEQLRERLG